MARIRAKNGNEFEVLDEDLAAYLVKQGHELLDDPAGDAGDGEPVEPNGRSSKEAWRAWAEHRGIEVPDDAKKGDIQALVAAAAEATATGEGTDDGDDEDDDESSSTGTDD